MTGLAIAAVVIAAIVCAPVQAFPWVISVLVALSVFEFAALLKLRIGFSLLYPVLFLFGAAVLVPGLSALAATALSHGNLMLLFLVATIKFSDVGGFAFGMTSAKLMKDRGGNHKLCPTISPNKSWEGLAGSLICSSIVSCAFIGVTGFSFAKSLAFGVAAAVLGTAGDLVESKFKRWVGVKDSSAWKITNGMGGFLDMFDSLLIAPAVLYWFL